MLNMAQIAQDNFGPPLAPLVDMQYCYDLLVVHYLANLLSLLMTLIIGTIIVSVQQIGSESEGRQLA